MDSDSENQDKLIPSTSNFEALRAIYDPEFETDDNTKCHDNVEKCVAFLEGRWRQKPKKVENPNPEPEVKLERQFLPEQLPVATRGRKPLRNVVKRMEDFNSTSGPLFVLKQCRDEKKRVRVWTRGVAGVRGVSTGFIVAFDKHWNLALTDVDEQFTRRRSRKAPVLGGDLPSTGAVGEQGLPGPNLREWRVGESIFRIVKVKKKVEIITRHVPQVLLRGEHVVMVSPEQQADNDQVGDAENDE